MKLGLFIVVHFYRVLSFLIFFPKKKKKKSILFLPAFFPENAGYHWRVKKWAELLEKDGYSVSILEATTKNEFYEVLPKNRSLFLIKYLQRRFWQVVASRKYETVIVRRELLIYNEYGNLFLEKLLLKFTPNAILDFDDDIAFAKREPRKTTSLYAKLLLENGSKFTESINTYQYFFAGSEYLKKYVLNLNPEAKVEVIPTCVDYEKHEPKKYDLEKEEVVFGWIGSNSNQVLLNNIIPHLNKLNEKHSISLLVISGCKYQNTNANFRIINKSWDLENEITNIKQIDIGLMPLNNTKEDKGKAGFKLVQYMGMGVIGVASAVTVNIDIIEDETNSFLVYDNNWNDTFNKVLNNKNNFDYLGFKARNKINSHYSFNSNFEKYLKLIKCVE